MAKISPGEGDIQARRLLDIDWLQASRTHHKTRRGCVSSSADFGPQTLLARHKTDKHNSWQLSTITDSITDDDFTCKQVICSSTTDHKITLLLLVHWNVWLESDLQLCGLQCNLADHNRTCCCQSNCELRVEFHLSDF